MYGIILSVLLLVIPLGGYCQTYTIDDYSDKFYFQIELNPEEEPGVFSSGKVLVYLKARDYLLLEVDCETFAFDPADFDAAIEKISFERQSVIVVRDFNFDGREDLAIQRYFSSKGPSYSVYLYNGSTFVEDERYTRIIQKSQGSFDLDPHAKEISIMGSGGCCYHVFSTYRVVDGIPFEQHTTIEEVDMPFHVTTTREWINDRMSENVLETADLDQEGIYPIISFRLQGKDKTAVLYNINNRMLNYVLLREGDAVEFHFPEEPVYKSRDFLVSREQRTVTFTNADARYQIYQKTEGGKLAEIGIRVDVGNKTYNIKGDIATLKGSLKNIPIEELDNVYRE